MQKVRCCLTKVNVNRLLTISFKSFHLHRSFFHLSLTVLFCCRSPKSFSIEGGDPQKNSNKKFVLLTVKPKEGPKQVFTQLNEKKQVALPDFKNLYFLSQD